MKNRENNIEISKSKLNVSCDEAMTCAEMFNT